MKRKERKRILHCGLKFGRKMCLVSHAKTGKSFLVSVGQAISRFLEFHLGNTEFSW